MHGMVRCKFQLHEEVQTRWTGAEPDQGKSRKFRFGAVWEGSAEKQAESENRIFGKWTPQGSIEITLKNPEAADFFELGKKYYVDFTEAPD